MSPGAPSGVRVAGVASTIDNDLLGTDLTIGATTAVDVALESVDRLRVTASSHGRVFLVEVMGRACGYIATAVGIASGFALVLGLVRLGAPSLWFDEAYTAEATGRSPASGINNVPATGSTWITSSISPAARCCSPAWRARG